MTFDEHPDGRGRRDHAYRWSGATTVRTAGQRRGYGTGLLDAALRPLGDGPADTTGRGGAR